VRAASRDRIDRNILLLNHLEDVICECAGQFCRIKFDRLSQLCARLVIVAGTVHEKLLVTKELSRAFRERHAWTETEPSRRIGREEFTGDLKMEIGDSWQHGLMLYTDMVHLVSKFVEY
jgi:hypothetical protein